MLNMMSMFEAIKRYFRMTNNSGTRAIRETKKLVGAFELFQINNYEKIHFYIKLMNKPVMRYKESEK